MSIDSSHSCNNGVGSGDSTAILRGVAVQSISASLAGDVVAIAGWEGLKSEITSCLICHNGDVFTGNIYKKQHLHITNHYL